MIIFYNDFLFYYKIVYLGFPHGIRDRYIGDFNDANQTNIYIVGSGNKMEVYTPFFAGAGFRYAQVKLIIR